MIRFLSSIALIAALGNAVLAVDPPAPVNLPEEARADGPRVRIGRPGRFPGYVNAFSADGQTAAVSISDDGTGNIGSSVHLWDVATGKHLPTPDWRKIGVGGFAFSNDGTLIATTCHDKTLRFWDRKTGKDITKAALPQAEFRFAVTFSPDGKRLLVAGPKLEMYDVESQKPLKEKEGYFAETEKNRHFGPITWSPKGKYVAAACENVGVRVWDAESGALVQLVPVPFSSRGTRFAFSADDKFLLISTWPEGLMKMFEVGKDKPVKTVDVPKGENSPEELQFAHEMGRMSWVVQSREHPQHRRTIAVADATGHEIKRFEVPAGVFSHRFTPDGSRIGVGGIDGSIRFYEAETGKLVSAALSGWRPIFQTVYLDGGKLLRVIHVDGLVHDFDPDSGKILRELQLDLTKATHLIAASSDGKLLASTSDVGECVLWDLSTGKELSKLKGTLHGYRENRGGSEPKFGPSQFAAAFSLDGRLFASVARGNSVIVWAATTGEERHTVMVPKGTGMLAFSTDATHIFTAENWPGEKAADGTGIIRRFELKTGKDVQHWEPIAGVAKKDADYVSSRVQSLLPLADGATLVVLESHLYNHKPRFPDLPATNGIPLSHPMIRLLALSEEKPGVGLRRADGHLGEDSGTGVGASSDGKQIGFVGVVPVPGKPLADAKSVLRIIDVATRQIREVELGAEQRWIDGATVTFRPGDKELVVTLGNAVLSVWELSKLKEKKPDEKKERHQ